MIHFIIIDYGHKGRNNNYKNMINMPNIYTKLE